MSSVGSFRPAMSLFEVKKFSTSMPQSHIRNIRQKWIMIKKRVALITIFKFGESIAPIKFHAHKTCTVERLKVTRSALYTQEMQQSRYRAYELQTRFRRQTNKCQRQEISTKEGNLEIAGRLRIVSVIEAEYFYCLVRGSLIVTT